MTLLQHVLGVFSGFVAGVLSGAFGVGGGIVTTPAIAVLLGGTPIQAVATPLPVIFPTALAGANEYRKAGQIDLRAVSWVIGPGVAGAIGGALLTQVINPHWFLLVTAVLLAWQAYRVVAGGFSAKQSERRVPGWEYGVAGLAAGLVSGLLGVGGGIVMVPIFANLLGMPLKRALGTSLVAITALVIPGTLVHMWLGHVDWRIFTVLVVGVVPGAWLGSRLALRAKERSLRLAVGSFLAVVAVAYGALEISRLLGWSK
jgi:hypothetical protein